MFCEEMGGRFRGAEEQIELAERPTICHPGVVKRLWGRCYEEM
jgi:hypothetical protein